MAYKVAYSPSSTSTYIFSPYVQYCDSLAGSRWNLPHGSVQLMTYSVRGHWWVLFSTRVRAKCILYNPTQIWVCFPGCVPAEASLLVDLKASGWCWRETGGGGGAGVEGYCFLFCTLLIRVLHSEQMLNWDYFSRLVLLNAIICQHSQIRFFSSTTCSEEGECEIWRSSSFPSSSFGWSTTVGSRLKVAKNIKLCSWDCS